MRSNPASTAGFTLIEVAVAMAIVGLVIMTFFGSRTDALADAREARNVRLAREIAQEVLSELKSGAREMPPDATRVPVEKHPGFEYQILVGETAIGDHESSALDWGADDGGRGDRMAWQRERDDIRTAQQKGLSLQDYRDQQLTDELDLDRESEVPSEDRLEEVLVVVYFPEVRIFALNRTEATFKLRAKVTTLAIEGLTPDEADDLARARGIDTETDSGTGEQQ